MTTRHLFPPARLAPLALAAALLAPSTQAAECTIFTPDTVTPGQPFDVRVSRVPGYPGGWFSPTLILKVDYPTNAGWAYSQREQRTVPKMGVIRLDATLLPPYSLYPDTLGGLLPGGSVGFTAIVREPSGGTYVNTICTGSSVVSF
ncbi:hypothetical protein E4634_06050 [Mangrovimicrobium sediminis]|uniref:Secreted protein n=1 Tax=Mangrovimicrobium sediminis TaxID=2562682 RepID=A0A4Z0M5R3_9GAMM|nr:hypothetical protein [Haliea sp. SAOS-164]TGD74760.1 hypothetical protein E4634_06050 [Haliea sp. SAOS-164]